MERRVLAPEPVQFTQGLVQELLPEGLLRHDLLDGPVAPALALPVAGERVEDLHLLGWPVLPDDPDLDDELTGLDEPELVPGLSVVPFKCVVKRRPLALGTG